MENVSKALLMAAGMLIGLLILSLAVYLFSTFGATSAEVHEQKKKQQIQQFNEQFTSYMEKDNVTIYDVVTAANIATETNIYYGFPRRLLRSQVTGHDNYISVEFRNDRISNTYNNQTIEKGYVQDSIAGTNLNRKYYNDLILESLEKDMENGELGTYNCEVLLSEDTGRAYRVIFERK